MHTKRTFRGIIGGTIGKWNNMGTEDCKPNRNSRFWKAVTFFWLMLAGIGAVLPLMPTTVFLLLAAWSAPKASPKLEKWLYEHPKFGPPLRAWRDERAVSMKGKITALVLMCISWSIIFYRYDVSIVSIMLGGLFLCVLTFLFSLPVPREPQ